MYISEHNKELLSYNCVSVLLISCPYEPLYTSSICHTLSEPGNGFTDYEQIPLSSGHGPTCGSEQGFVFVCVLVFLYLQRENDLISMEIIKPSLRSGVIFKVKI